MCRMEKRKERYLDLFSGWAVSSFGHYHLAKQSDTGQGRRLWFMPNTFYSEPQGRLASIFLKNSFNGQCFSVTGAEANEAAIKLARIHCSPKGKYRLLL